MLKKLTEALFLLTVASLPFVSLPQLLGIPLRTQYTEYFFLASAAALAAAFAAGGLAVRRGAFYVPVVVYVIAAVVSTIFSSDRFASLIKLAGVAYLAGLSVLAFNVVRDTGSARKAVLAWLAGTAVAVGYAVLVLMMFYVNRESAFVEFGLSHYGTFPPGNYPRIQSLFANPNMFCNYLNISWMLVLAGFERKWIGRTAAIVLGALILISAFLTLSPGIGGLFLCTGLWIWWRSRGAQTLVPRLVLGGALLISAAFLAVTAVRFDQGLTVSSEPSARVLTWSSAAENMIDEPVAGKGLGTYAADVRYKEQRLRDAHNSFLNVGAESGVVGLAALIFFCWWFVSRSFDPVVRAGPDKILLTALGFAFLSSFIYQGLAGSFEDARHAWVLAGLIGAVSAIDYGEARDD